MKIESLRIQNFRSFEQTTIQLNDYTCLVGPNGAGKSTILTALNVFFREYENASTDLSNLGIEDFHSRNINLPVKITVTFTDLNEEAQADFANYYRHGKLVISTEASYNEDNGISDVKQFGERVGMASFAPFFKAESDRKSAAELKEIYAELKSTYTELPPPSTKPKMIEALKSYESDHPEDCEFIPSEDQFYGFSRGSNRLARYIQWIYVPAVKDASSEQIEAKNTALGKLLSRTVRSKADFGESVSSLRSDMQQQYQELLNENQYVLDEMSDALQNRLSEWAHPDASLRLRWKQDSEKSVRVDEPWAHVVAGEGEFEGELSRFGHGLQRSYLLALLQELAGADDTGAPTLILACEEPELYQHPPQARHLAEVLQRISQDNTQVIVTTHNPLFVSGEGFEDVRMVRKDSSGLHSKVSHVSFLDVAETYTEILGRQHTKPQGVLAKVHQALQLGLNEMFFTRRLILVEGLEDASYILAYMNLLELSDEFRRLGCHIVPVNGKSQLIQPVVIAKHMRIPTYLVFDSDGDKPDVNGSRSKHKKDNIALLNLSNVLNPDPFPSDSFWGPGITMWNSDIGKIVETEFGRKDWGEYQDRADRRYGQIGGLKKNTLHIGTSLAFAWEDGKRSDNLRRLCKEILNPENLISYENL